LIQAYSLFQENGCNDSGYEINKSTVSHQDLFLRADTEGQDLARICQKIATLALGFPFISSGSRAK
jgi:hypothetical protein